MIKADTKRGVDMGRLDGKVAVITGGASGIGEATVRLFVKEEARVVIADIQDERGKRLASELGTFTSFHHTDVSEESDIKEVTAYAVKKFGRLDCIFNNAGIPGIIGGLEEISVEDFDRTIGVDLRGVFLGLKHAAPIMKRQGSGSIISNASVAGLRTGYGPHIYSAVKAAVIHLTCSVAMELGESGVRVNCVCPGGIATPIFGKSLGLSPEAADKTVEVVKAGLKNVQPICRSGTAEDIAQAVLWLASDESSFVNGHALVVDGGLIGGQKWSFFKNMMEQMGNVMGVKV
jgi:NAD(P)-dependent dehydrogenase (short-subunit alcohol dehydrogenase family)